MPRPLPTQERLRELLDYHEDGYFIRRAWVSNHGGKVGDEVRGSPSHGYLATRVDGTQYLLHRLIFKWHHGWCPDIVDHYPDRDKTNCRVGNLRPATPQESTDNQDPGAHSDSQTGVRGVSPYRGRYRAQVGHRHLGYFASVEAGAAAIKDFNRRKKL